MRWTESQKFQVDKLHTVSHLILSKTIFRDLGIMDGYLVSEFWYCVISIVTSTTEQGYLSFYTLGDKSLPQKHWVFLRHLFWPLMSLPQNTWTPDFEESIHMPWVLAILPSQALLMNNFHGSDLRLPTMYSVPHTFQREKKSIPLHF